MLHDGRLDRRNLTIQNVGRQNDVIFNYKKKIKPVQHKNRSQYCHTMLSACVCVCDCHFDLFKYCTIVLQQRNKENNVNNINNNNCRNFNCASCRLIYCLWGDVVELLVGHRTCDLLVAGSSPALALLHVALGKLLTHVPLSPSSIIWYRQKLGSKPPLKLRPCGGIEMCAYYYYYYYYYYYQEKLMK